MTKVSILTMEPHRQLNVVLASCEDGWYDMTFNPMFLGKTLKEAIKEIDKRGLVEESHIHKIIIAR